MYHGILLANTGFYIGNNPSQAICNSFVNNLFQPGGWLDTVDATVAALKTEVGDASYLLNIMIATCYAPEQPNGNAQQNDQTIINNWGAKAYANLALAGFEWEYVEAPYQDPSSDCVAESVNSWLHSFAYSFRTLWIPWYNAWRDATTCPSSGHTWQGWGFDYTVAQPNYAFSCPKDLTHFSSIASDMNSYPLSGIEFEIAGITVCGATDSIEINANTYLDAGFQYSWYTKPMNVFWWAPSFLSNYALGLGRTPGFGWSYEPKSFDRAIYDRQWEFIRGYVSASLPPNDDASVWSAFPDQNYGSDSRLFVGTNAYPNTFRSYLKWNLQGVVPLASYVTTATLSVYLQAWYYGAIMSDGQLYGIQNPTWTERGITWNNQPASSSWILKSSGLIFSSPGWYQFDVTSNVQSAVNTGSWNVSFMFKRATEDLSAIEFYFNSKESTYTTLRPALSISFVKSTVVRQVVTQDSYVQSYAPNVNYVSEPRLILGTNAAPNVFRPYFMIRLSAYESAMVMYQGTLVLFLSQFRYGTSITDCQLYFVSTNTWDESSITWNNQPSSSNWQLRLANVQFNSQTTTYWLTGINSDLANQWQATNASFLLKRATEDLSGLELELRSNRYATNPDQMPQIWIILKPY
jgi:hypothetical protein